jgi:hypothetical protein
LGGISAIRPSGPITNVVRLGAHVLAPDMDFSAQTSYFSATA